MKLVTWLKMVQKGSAVLPGMCMEKLPVYNEIYRCNTICYDPGGERIMTQTPTDTTVYVLMQMVAY